MRFGRHASALALLSAFFLLAADAEAQTGASYRFLEVLDVAGQPVAEAEVTQIPSHAGPWKTDARGVLEQFPVYVGDFNTHGLRVSKPGYLPHEETGLRNGDRHPELFRGEVPGYDPSKIRVVLLREPATDAERRAVEAELRGRELLLAVRRRDLAGVERLLRAGASADARDPHGIPAILFAAADGDAQTVRALLRAGADVRNKGRPGRKALLYYFDSMRSKCAADVELVRALVKAGADVNAARRDGTTVLSLAARCADSTVVKLLEKAGARRG